jgi:hypothetical protein
MCLKTFPYRDGLFDGVAEATSEVFVLFNQTRKFGLVVVG